MSDQSINSSLIIRELRASDEGHWWRLWTEYLKFYETSVSEEIYEITFHRILSDEVGDCAGFIAFLGDQPVGLVHCLYHKNFWQKEDVCYLQDLYTSAESRNKGVGRALINQVYAKAKSRGVDKVYWMTHETNHNARKLYDKVANRSGFIEYCNY